MVFNVPFSEFFREQISGFLRFRGFRIWGFQGLGFLGLGVLRV